MALSLVASLWTAAQAAGVAVVHCVTFAAEPSVQYVPIRPTAQALGIVVEWSPEKGAHLGDVKIDEATVRRTADGTRMVPLRSFEAVGVVADYDEESRQTRLAHEAHAAVVVPGSKRVEISLSKQLLRAWQGPYLVLENPVSTGRRGFTTPRGQFVARTRERMRYSRLYHNSPMPYSVQINGHIFIHGYKSVPRYPASHGCIRMPMWGENAAKLFFEWVEVGTPVSVLVDFRESGPPDPA